jgi:hypothetical protein
MRYLIVAHKTLGGDHLLDHVKACMAKGPCTFHLLVPVVHPTNHAWTEAEVEMAARERLEEGLARFRHAGAEVTGEVGDVNPVSAIGDVLRRDQIDEIILSTLPPGPSRWLKMDVPHRVERQFPVPLTHLVDTRTHVG